MNTATEALVTTETNNERKSRKVLRKIIGSIAVISLATTAVVVAAKDEVFGTLPHKRTPAEQSILADQKGLAKLQNATQAQRYVDLFLQNKESEYRDTISVGEYFGGKGIIGAVASWGDGVFERQYGQSCLAGTAFDTRSTSERDYSTRSNTQATLVTRGGDEVLVYPGSSKASPLLFKVDQSGLFHPDEQTQSTLLANGCDAEIKM